MTPEAAHVALLAELTDAFTRTHTDPAADAQTFLGRLTRAGWRYQPAVADRPGPTHPAPRPVAEAALAQMRADVAEVKRAREEREADEARQARGGAA